MSGHIVKIKSIDKITHDVLMVVTERPEDYDFEAGQATEVSINKTGWKRKRRPFTFTCLPDNANLEFTIKTYPDHKGVTNHLLKLKKDDELILHDVFGAINYKGEGVFIAGGAGVTPFISILRWLHSKKEIRSNTLLFANKTKSDIIHQHEFEQLLGRNFVNILSDEKLPGYINGYITEELIAAHTGPHSKTFFYVCGPPPMMDAIDGQLANLHVPKNLIVTESF